MPRGAGENEPRTTVLGPTPLRSRSFYLQEEAHCHAAQARMPFCWGEMRRGPAVMGRLTIPSLATSHLIKKLNSNTTAGGAAGGRRGRGAAGGPRLRRDAGAAGGRAGQGCVREVARKYIIYMNEDNIG